jgi:hypothetical protein
MSRADAVSKASAAAAAVAAKFGVAPVVKEEEEEEEEDLDGGTLPQPAAVTVKAEAEEEEEEDLDGGTLPQPAANVKVKEEEEEEEEEEDLDGGTLAPAPPPLSAAETALAAHHDALSARGNTRVGLGAGGHDDEVAARSVAAMYNGLGDRHRTLDAGSDILQLRNLNNWIKAVLFQKHLPRGSRGRGAAVLDLACGKGGDMPKFKKANVAVYVGVDIAANSVRDAATRYNGANNRPPMPFAATFVAGDVCDAALFERLALPPALRFNLASCQFAMHYAFATEARATALFTDVTHAPPLTIGGR